MKGAKAQEELNDAANALHLLGCGTARLISCPLYRVDQNAPAFDGNVQTKAPEPAVDPETRAIILATKQKRTPLQYPRKYAQILKKPL